MEFATADLSDAFPEVAIAEPVFRDFGGRRRFHGVASTVLTFEDNSLVRTALSEPGDGRGLIVDGGASLRCALVGDLLAALGGENDWAGIVVNGCVRDSAVLAGIPFGVKALATCPRKSVKLGRGERDVPVTFAGVTFVPGDHVYADEDGVLVSAEELQIP